MSVVDFLRVTPPALPPEVRRNDITGIKLARHVAVLFGVDVPENPTATVWVSDFNKVTVGDIGRGAPKAVLTKGQTKKTPAAAGTYIVKRALAPTPGGGPDNEEPNGTVEIREVPSATLNRFKPDTKAAALLSGADQLFGELEDTFRDTIRVLGTLEDGSLLADTMRIGIWASLVAEVYRSQPALFNAAVQARLTQRAALSYWRPLVPLEQSEDTAACEFAHETNDDYWKPGTLGILDDVIRNYVRPSIGLDGGQEDDPNREFLIDGLVDRWCRHLTQSADRGMTWTVQTKRRRTVEIYLSGLMPLGRFLSEVHLLSPNITPYGEKGRAPWVKFDADEASHRRRIRPRVPSRAELSSLPEKSQQAIVHTLLCLHRVIRDAPGTFRDKDRKMYEDLSADQQNLSDLSSSLWGGDAPLSVMARHFFLRGKITLERERDVKFVDNVWEEFETNYRNLARLRDRGELTSGEWVDLVVGSSPTRNGRAQDLHTRGRDSEAEALRAEVDSDWWEVFRLLGISDQFNNDGPHGPDKFDPALTHQLLHNYLGFALVAPNATERLAAIRFGQNIVLPIRRMRAQSLNNDNAARLTTQIVLRATAQLAAEHENIAVVNELLASCFTLLQDLLQTTLVKELMNGKSAPKTSSDLTTLLTICGASLVLYEKNTPSPLDPQEMDRILNLANQAFYAVTSGRQHAGEKTTRSENLGLYQARWDRVRKTL